MFEALAKLDISFFHCCTDFCTFIHTNTHQRSRFMWPALARHDLHLLSTIFDGRMWGNFNFTAPQYAKTVDLKPQTMQAPSSHKLRSLRIMTQVLPQIIKLLKQRYFPMDKVPSLPFCSKGEFSLHLQVWPFCFPSVTVAHNFCMQYLLTHGET